MQWCNCSHDDDYYNLSTSVNECGLNGHPTCWSCNNRIANEDLILLLMKEVKRLNQTVEQLEFEKQDRERIKFEEEVKKMDEEAKEMEEDRIALENVDKQTERFIILDL